MPRKPPPRNHSCTLCGRKGPGPLCELAGADGSLFRGARSILRYPAGQVIFHQGQPPFALFCLASGQAKVYKTSETGQRLIIRVLGPGELLGYRGALSNEPFAATAETIKPSVICSIPRERFIEILRSSPDLSLRLLRKLARDLRISEEQLLSVASQPVQVRIARLLLLLIEASGATLRANIPIPADYRRNEMAEMIGTAPETLSRALARMARQGLIRISRKEIRVASPKRLAEVAGLPAGT